MSNKNLIKAFFSRLNSSPMSFDSHSVERLRKLSRELPQALPTPNSKLESKQVSSSKSHPIETEKNPQELFKELIKASPDGNIPKHLLARLKELEKNALENKFSNLSKSPLSPNLRKNDPPNELYISFKKLLLEEEEDYGFEAPLSKQELTLDLTTLQ